MSGLRLDPPESLQSASLQASFPVHDLFVIHVIAYIPDLRACIYDFLAQRLYASTPIWRKRRAQRLPCQGLSPKGFREILLMGLVRGLPVQNPMRMIRWTLFGLGPWQSSHLRTPVAPNGCGRVQPLGRVVRSSSWGFGLPLTNPMRTIQLRLLDLVPGRGAVKWVWTHTTFGQESRLT